MMARACRMAALVVALLALAGPSHASAGIGDLADQTALAKHFAPVLSLATDRNCGPGEAYLPMDINALLGNATVALRGPWGRGDLVKIAPSGEDLAQGLYDYHLDFPGDALDPGCSYVHWSRRVTAGKPAVAYAHVVGEADAPGKLALQYWYFYAFNDWNNLHEGDWEMVQLEFDAATAREALTRTPASIGYSQHEGAERAQWGDSKLALVDGTHPVLHPASGSHAGFYSSTLFLGASGSTGVGCDDTRGPSSTVRPAVETIPSDPAAARQSFPWIAFQGRWGELQPAFFNGPTGPNLKTQWTEPFRWSSGWRDRSVAVPAGGVLGTTTTTFFCGAIAHGSNVVRRALDHPWGVLLGLAALVALVVLAASRATWRPSAPLRLARRRASGQILGAATRMYFGHFWLFVGIGSIFIPLSVLDAIVQTILLGASSFAGIDAQGEGEGVLVLFVAALGTALTLLGVAIVMAATIRALAELDAGRRASALQAYRLVRRSVRPMLGALVVAAVIVTALTGTIVLIPVAIALVIRWALIVPVTEIEDRSALGALRRSGRLIGRRWPKVACLSVLSLLLVLVAGPVLGTLLVLFTGVSLGVANAVAGVVYAVLMPFVAITTAYVYFDARVRHELEESGEREPEVLDAEIELAT
jgi:hypothetical protein